MWYYMGEVNGRGTEFRFGKKDEKWYILQQICISVTKIFCGSATAHLKISKK